MRFDILTLFPDFFSSPLSQSITGKAIEKGLIEVGTHNIRDYATDRHRTTDDSPYGGGAGMVMKVEPVVAALRDLQKRAEGDGTEKHRSKVVLATPQGIPFSHSLARDLSSLAAITIVCGRYEGVDERIRNYVDLEVSIGDYVLTGEEIPALVIMDAVSRFVPGVLGKEASPEVESFSEGLLEYPQYTRPEQFEGMKVPDVLLSGNHAEIERWRRAQSLLRTKRKRPDLFGRIELTDEDRRLIERLKAVR